MIASREVWSLLTALTICQQAVAQTFGPSQVLTNGLGGRGIVGADFNHDGFTDLALTQYHGGRVWWLAGLGAGSFDQPEVLTGSPQFPREVYAVDMDGDADLDVLFSSLPNTGWMENLGNGSFGSPYKAVGTGQSAYAISAGDLDGDGLLDIAFGDSYQTRWSRQIGGGVFDAPVGIGSTSQARSICIGDLDNDGDPDIAVASFWDDAIYAFLNEGSGIFPTRTLITNTTDGAHCITASDMDRDGDLDLVSSATLDGELSWYKNVGGANFRPEVTLISTPGFTAFEHCCEDIDGDGDLDVVAAGQGGPLAFVENLGLGNFAAPVFLPGPTGSGDATCLCDIDNDGDLDAVGISDDYVWWHENLTGPFDCNGNGTPDSLEITAGTAPDCDANGVPDECDLTAGAPDCNGNGTLDSCDIAAGTATDCNANQIPDACDLLTGTSLDCDANGIPDECDIASGASDCDADGIPDACQITGDATLDLNANGVLDSCEAIGTNYCSPAIANSTGASAEILALGSELLFFSDVTLTVRGLPQNTFAMFFASQTQGYAFPIPGSQGALCVLGLTGRYNRPGQIMSSGGSGTLMFPIDVLSIPTPMGSTFARPGETWNFQAWYRDANPTVTSNFTDAVGIRFQ